MWRELGQEMMWVWTNKLWQRWRGGSKLKKHWDFPGGAVVKNPPANAGDVGSIPGPGTEIPHAVEQLSLHTTTTEAWAPRGHALQQGKPPQWEAHEPQRRVAPARHN